MSGRGVVGSARVALTGVGLTLAACGGGGGGPAPAPQAAVTPAARAGSGTRPNIVFVLSDDQELSVENMPRLRALLGDQGVTFEQHVVNTPLCCPSRATLLTGLLAHTHGVHTNRAPDGGFEGFRDRGHESRSVATWLRAAGYRTALVGKYLNRYPGDARDANPTYVPPGWDLFAAYFAPDRTSGRYYDFFVNLGGEVSFYPERPDDYITDSIARQALAFIDALPRETPAPFFLHVTPNAPHNPPVPAPRHTGVLGGLRAPRSGAFDEADVSDKPAYVRALPRLDERGLARIDDLYRRRQETLLAIDELIAALLRRLEERGLLDNTYVFFASDNGYMQGQHRFPNGKDAPYDESVRVPLLVRGPGVPRGVRLPHLVANVDLPVTFAELGGAAAPSNVEGRSLVPLLRSNPPAPEAWRTDVLLQHWTNDEGEGSIPEYTGLRTLRHTLVVYETGESELYDLTRDPGQEENLAGRPESRALYTELRQRLEQLRVCRGSACR